MPRTAVSIVLVLVIVLSPILAAAELVQAKAIGTTQSAPARSAQTLVDRGWPRGYSLR
jgi:hypothetical protein